MHDWWESNPMRRFPRKNPDTFDPKSPRFCHIPLRSPNQPPGTSSRTKGKRIASLVARASYTSRTTCVTSSHVSSSLASLRPTTVDVYRVLLLGLVPIAPRSRQDTDVSSRTCPVQLELLHHPEAITEPIALPAFNPLPVSATTTRSSRCTSPPFLNNSNPAAAAADVGST